MVGDGDEAIMVAMRGFLASISAAMGLITGVRCRVCIKELLGHGTKYPYELDDLYVVDYCRDDRFADPETPGSRDWVKDNTDFEALLRRAEPPKFVSNDIHDVPGYKNSHFAPGMREYPYRSVMVLPIRRRLSSPLTAEQVKSLTPEQDVIGFLCIDSKEPDVFDERLDVEFAAVFADAAYPMLTTRRELRKEPGSTPQTSDPEIKQLPESTTSGIRSTNE
jgi:hypothetical protein